MTETDDVRVTGRGDDWIDVTRRFRLWAAIPAHERVTAGMIEDYYSPKLHERHGQYRDVELERLANPRCIVAVVAPSYRPYRGLWQPCQQHVAEGADLCRSHGGPSARKARAYKLNPSRDVLEAEIARLRALVEKA